ncbi:MAG: cytochrome c [Phycisphaerales bacterium JB039]
MPRLLLLTAATIFLLGCAGDGAPPPTAPEPEAAAPGAWSNPQEAPGLHNLIEVAPGVWSGSQPEGPEAFDELARLGVRTILSVDGATPDVELAGARGMRYAHVPVRYSEITLEQRLAIARAMRDLEGPIYIHCHHGLHRGPAAAALGLVSLGQLTPDQGVTFMKLAGTASSYPGLYACVAGAGELTPEQIEVADIPPETAPVPAFAAAMAHVSRIDEHLDLVEAAGWQTPAEHPDLVPASEAGQLADILRVLSQRREPADQPEDFYTKLAASAAAAQALEDAIVAGAGAADLRARMGDLRTSCRDCHRVYRNRQW